MAKIETPQEEFQYGERLLFQSGSSYISAVCLSYPDQSWFANRV